MEYLGAVAASLQLANMCYDVQNHFRNLPGDLAFLAVLREKCESLLQEIQQQENQFQRDQLREAAESLKEQLKEITAKVIKIEGKTGIAKAFTSIGKHATGLKAQLDCALLEYQAIALTHGNIVLERIERRVDPEGIPADIKQTLSPMIERLSTQNTELRDMIANDLEGAAILVQKTEDIYCIVKEIDVRQSQDRDTSLQTLDTVRQFRNESNLTLSSLLIALNEVTSGFAPSSSRPQPPDPEQYVTLKDHLRARREVGDCLREGEIWDIFRGIVSDINASYTLMNEFSFKAGIPSFSTLILTNEIRLFVTEATIRGRIGF